MISFRLRIRRNSPSEGLPAQYIDYEVPLHDKMTILDALAWVQSHQAHDLAFRYSCRVGMCGTCTVVINGREEWACRTLVEDLRTHLITVEPLRHLPIIKDLVVDMRPFFEKFEAAVDYFVPGEEDQDFARISPRSKERLMIDPHIECISCAACYSSCTMVYWDRDYLGPAALNRAATLVMDSRDRAGDSRLEVIDGEHGCWRCHSQFTCTEVCPMELRPAEAIGYLKRRIVSGSLKKLLPSKARPAPMDMTEESEPHAADIKPAPSFLRSAIFKLSSFLGLMSRPILSALTVSIFVGVIYLLSLGASAKLDNNDFLFPEGELNPLRLAGALLYEENGCDSCHSVLGYGGRSGPDLWRVGGKRHKDWLRKLFKDPDSVISGSGMPAYDLSEPEMAALVDYVHSLDFSRQSAVRIPRSIARGGGELYRSGCLDCHSVNSEGDNKASDLGKIAKMRGSEWLMAVLLESNFHKQIETDSFAKLSEKRVKDIVHYLSLKIPSGVSN